MDNQGSHNLTTDEKQIDNYVYNYKTGRLGRGAYGTVYRGRNIQNNQDVAIKIVRKKDLEDKDDELQLFQEIQIMESIISTNVVRLYDVLQTDNNYYIVMEFCLLGDLDRAMNKLNSIEPNDHYKFLVNILTAFISLIGKGIIHRDLKPANILVTREGNEVVFKLGDFGFARKLTSYKREMLDSKVGTPLYMSPQLLDNQIYTSKSDIWSLALIMYQIIYLKTPWTGRTEEELLSKILNTPLVFPEKPKISDLAKDFMKGCLQIHEKDRFNWDQLYRHPYVSIHFQNYVEVSKQLENKVSFLLNSLRAKVRASNLYQLFSDLDRSGDRALNLEEFSELMWKIDKDLDKREIQMVFDEIDIDGNGDIDFLEFKRALKLDEVEPSFKKVQEARMNERVFHVLKRFSYAVNKYKINLFQLFSKYDTSGNGSLDRSEIQELFQKIDSSLTETDIVCTINLFDANGDGEIQFMEFKKVFDDLENERCQSYMNKTQSSKSNKKINNHNEIKQYFSQQSLQSKAMIEEDDAEDEKLLNDCKSLNAKQNPLKIVKTNDGISIIPMIIPKRK